jgi:uncharacterized membrane protein
LRNFAALTVFTLVWMGLVLGVFLLTLVLAAMLGQPDIMGMVLFPVAMLMAAMFFSSIYFTFRDSFVLEEKSAGSA